MAGRPPRFIAEKRPLKLCFPEASGRQWLQSTRKRFRLPRIDVCEAVDGSAPVAGCTFRAGRVAPLDRIQV